MALPSQNVLFVFIKAVMTTLTLLNPFSYPCPFHKFPTKASSLYSGRTVLNVFYLGTIFGLIAIFLNSVGCLGGVRCGRIDNTSLIMRLGSSSYLYYMFVSYYNIILYKIVNVIFTISLITLKGGRTAKMSSDIKK